MVISDIQNNLVICYSAWIHESATDAVKIFNRRAEAASGLAIATAEDLQVETMLFIVLNRFQGFFAI